MDGGLLSRKFFSLVIGLGGISSLACHSREEGGYLLGMQEFLHGKYSLPVLVSQASHFLRDVIQIGLEPRGLAMMELFLKYLFGLELNRWRGLADSRPAHPSGRQGKPQCISLLVIVTSEWVPRPQDVLRN